MDHDKWWWITSKNIGHQWVTRDAKPCQVLCVGTVPPGTNVSEDLWATGEGYHGTMLGTLVVWVTHGTWKTMKNNFLFIFFKKKNHLNFHFDWGAFLPKCVLFKSVEFLYLPVAPIKAMAARIPQLHSAQWQQIYRWGHLFFSHTLGAPNSSRQPNNKPRSAIWWF